MTSVEDILDRNQRIEFISTPCDLLTEAIRDYGAKQPKEIRIEDTHIGQQAILWAQLGNEIIGAEDNRHYS